MDEACQTRALTLRQLSLFFGHAHRRRGDRPGRADVRLRDPVRGVRPRPERHRRPLVRVPASSPPATRRVRTQTGFMIDSAVRARRRSSARTRSSCPGWADPEVEPSPALSRALRAAHARGARIVSLCTGRVRARRTRACSTAGARRRTGCTPSACSSAIRASSVDPDRALRRRRQRHDLGRHRRGHRPLPASRRARPRRRRRGRRRAAARDAAATARAARRSTSTRRSAAATGGAIDALLDWGARAARRRASRSTISRARGAMSTRTLTRRFRAAIGMPPGEWLQRERLRLAQRLLEPTDDPVELRRAPRRLRRARPRCARSSRAGCSTSPRAYRQTFRA